MNIVLTSCAWLLVLILATSAYLAMFGNADRHSRGWRVFKLTFTTLFSATFVTAVVSLFIDLHHAGLLR